MVKLVIGAFACALLMAAWAQAEEANIISNTNIQINGKKTHYRGHKGHTALHIQIHKDILINNVVELVQAVYSACVTSKSKHAGKKICREKTSKVVTNGLDVIFEVIDLTNHMLMKGVKLGTNESQKALGNIARLLGARTNNKNRPTKKPRRRQ